MVVAFYAEQLHSEGLFFVRFTFNNRRFDVDKRFGYKTIGHFRVALNLVMTARLRANKAFDFLKNFFFAKSSPRWPFSG